MSKQNVISIELLYTQANLCIIPTQEMINMNNEVFWFIFMSFKDSTSMTIKIENHLNFQRCLQDLDSIKPKLKLLNVLKTTQATSYFF